MTEPTNYGAISVAHGHMFGEPVVALARTDDEHQGIILMPDEWDSFLAAIREPETPPELPYERDGMRVAHRGAFVGVLIHEEYEGGEETLVPEDARRVAAAIWKASALAEPIYLAQVERRETT